MLFWYILPNEAKKGFEDYSMFSCLELNKAGIKFSLLINYTQANLKLGDYNGTISKIAPLDRLEYLYSIHIYDKLFPGDILN